MTMEEAKPNKKALYVEIEARPEKAAEVADLLENGLAFVLDEPGTRHWFAIRLEEHSFAIFDTFPDDAARSAHLAGRLAQALMACVPELLVAPPRIRHADVLASKT